MKQLIANLLKKLRRGKGRRGNAGNASRPLCRPQLLPLEDRTLPAVTPTGTLTGLAFLDRNLNGVFNPGVDLRLASAPIRLQGTTKSGETVNATVVANALGRYTYLNLQPGTYHLSSGPGVIPLAASFAAPVQADGVTPVFRNLAFTRIIPGYVSLRDFLTSTVVPSATVAATNRSNSAPTVVLAQAANRYVTVGQGSANTVFDLSGFFTDANLAAGSLIRIHTNQTLKNGALVAAGTAGSSPLDINILLYDKDAARTVSNFLNYVQSGRYDNTIFERLVSGFVLQGGGYQFSTTGSTGSLNAVATDAPVQNEFSTSRSNLQYTLAMAKLPSPNVDGPANGGPDSATNEFFFNLANNATNLDNQNGGFTVFARVLTSTDQDAVKALATMTTQNKGGFPNLPLSGYTGTTFPTDATDANFALIKSVEVIKVPEYLKYEIVSNSNPGLFVPGGVKLVNNRLTLDYKDGQFGTAVITVRATDRFGASVLTRFTVKQLNGHAPTATAVTLSNTGVGLDSTGKPTEALTATVTGAADPDPSTTVKLTYVWTVNGTEVHRTANTTATSDTLTVEQLTALNLKVGDIVAVAATPNDGSLNGATLYDTAKVTHPPTATVVFNTSSPKPGDTLTATVTKSDSDSSDAVTLTYEWYLGTATTPVKTTSNTSSSTDTFQVPVGTAAGTVVRVVVTPNDGHMNGAAATPSVPATVINALPTVSVSLDGIPAAGETLTATATPNDANGDPVTLTYNWYVGTSTTPVQTTSNTSSTTDTFIVPLNIGVGDVITVVVTPHDATDTGNPAMDTLTA